jgi:hypothetical protein
MIRDLVVTTGAARWRPKILALDLQRIDMRIRHEHIPRPNPWRRFVARIRASGRTEDMALIARGEEIDLPW